MAAVRIAHSVATTEPSKSHCCQPNVVNMESIDLGHIYKRHHETAAPQLQSHR